MILNPPRDALCVWRVGGELERVSILLYSILFYSQMGNYNLSHFCDIIYFRVCVVSISYVVHGSYSTVYLLYICIFSLESRDSSIC